MSLARLDGYDIYHGNVITDITKIPHFPVIAHKACEGANSKDPLVVSRLPQLSADGKFIYLWISPGDPAAAQFANFQAQIRACSLLDAAGKIKPGFGLMLDWERTQGKPFPTLDLVNQIHALIQATYPGRLITYSAPWVSGFLQWRAANPTAPLWYADYSPAALADAAKYNATLVQFTNSAIIPGFAAPVDGDMILRQDVLNGVLGIVPTPPVVIKPAPPIVNPAPPPEGQIMNTIVKVLVPGDPNNATYGAILYGEMDSRGIIRDVVWSGRGDGPGGADVLARYNAYIARGVPTTTLNLSDLKNVNLVGNVPQGDTRTWSAGDFAPNS